MYLYDDSGEGLTVFLTNWQINKYLSQECGGGLAGSTSLKHLYHDIGEGLTGLKHLKYVYHDSGEFNRSLTW